MFLVLLLAFVIAALANTFGQANEAWHASSAAATLTMTAPERIRGGLLYQAVFRIHAIKSIETPVLVLDDGLVNQTTLNALEPEPAGVTSDARHLKLRFNSLSAGRTLVVYVDFQANPTNIGTHEAGAAIYDGTRPLASITRTQTNFP